MNHYIPVFGTLFFGSFCAVLAAAIVFMPLEELLAMNKMGGGRMKVDLLAKAFYWIYGEWGMRYLVALFPAFGAYLSFRDLLRGFFGRKNVPTVQARASDSAPSKANKQSSLF
jgi:hypothetical protein